jgi:hypothetical protein
MILALLVSALVAATLLADVLQARLADLWRRVRAGRRVVPEVLPDPGRERRAEQTARELLRSCVGEEEWDMYRSLGFIRVWSAGAGLGSSGAEQAYLIYPHGPIVCYEPQTGRLVSEHCVSFPDHSRPFGSPQLPDSDDVLAKWMALTGDERRLLASANMHLPGRHMDQGRVRRDLWRLSRWEQVRARRLMSLLPSVTEADPSSAADPADPA